MKSPSDVTRCTVRDGAVWIHLDNVRVHIPSHILNKSQILKDGLSSGEDSSVGKKLTLAAPEERLQAWMACYGGEEERLRYAGTKDLVNCLLVRIHLLESSCRRAQSCLMVYRCRCCVDSLSCVSLCTKQPTSGR
jgi:hypothetical protein